jgi:hypothetical protein
MMQNKKSSHREQNLWLAVTFRGPTLPLVEITIRRRHGRLTRSSPITRIRCEFQSFHAKWPEKPAFVSKMFAAVAQFSQM